ncbi:DUF6431 domain-containing protein [Streptomyces cupreus]|uniref:DUF6431 domain-containing protein n=1 Tax=Streptomyces cupreus TaxID=2759956 RepID=UPI003AB96878
MHDDTERTTRSARSGGTECSSSTPTSSGRKERQLRAGKLTSPACGAVLAPRGHRRRSAMISGARLFVRPRRSHCTGCQITHMLLPKMLWPRRTDAAEVIGAGPETAAPGPGQRQVAAHLCQAEGTRSETRRLACPGDRLRPGRAEMAPGVRGGPSALRRWMVGDGGCAPPRRLSARAASSPALHDMPAPDRQAKPGSGSTRSTGDPMRPSPDHIRAIGAAYLTR